MPRYRLHDCGSYPGLVEAAGGTAIEGELWSVDASCLKTLDEIECVDEGLFQRVRIDLESPHDSLEAETYLYQPDVEGFPDCGSRW